MTPLQMLTVCQPYAHLIAIGAKPIENRTWPTAWRGELAIHAGKSRDWLEAEDKIRYPNMAYGAIVAVVQVVACLHHDTSWPDAYTPLWSHEHAHGPWCWVLEHVDRLVVPVPARGAQGIVLVSTAIAAQVRAAAKVRVA